MVYRLNNPHSHSIKKPGPKIGFNPRVARQMNRYFQVYGVSY